MTHLHIFPKELLKVLNCFSIKSILKCLLLVSDYPQYELRSDWTKMSVTEEKDNLETETDVAPGEEKQKYEAQLSPVFSSGDMENKNDETKESDDEDSSMAGTPHAKSVRKQRYASKLLKRRINNINEPVSQVYLPEETDWIIHDNSFAETSQKSEWSNYR